MVVVTTPFKKDVHSDLYRVLNGLIVLLAVTRIRIITTAQAAKEPTMEQST